MSRISLVANEETLTNHVSYVNVKSITERVGLKSECIMPYVKSSRVICPECNREFQSTSALRVHYIYGHTDAFERAKRAAATAKRCRDNKTQVQMACGSKSGVGVTVHIDPENSDKKYLLVEYEGKTYKVEVA